MNEEHSWTEGKPTKNIYIDLDPSLFQERIFVIILQSRYLLDDEVMTMVPKLSSGFVNSLNI